MSSVALLTALGVSLPGAGSRRFSDEAGACPASSEGIA
jgi:hypothetical protein